MFVNISSPSSSKYKSVSDLGSPEEAGERIARQLLSEFMSTRIGVRREGDIVSAVERTGSDGQLYYDIQVTPGPCRCMHLCKYFLLSVM